MIYEFMGEIVTEEALEEKIDDEVDSASFNSLALACYILAHDENVDSFEEFDSNSIDKFDNWTNEIIEKAIFSDFQLLILKITDMNQKKTQVTRQSGKWIGAGCYLD